MPIVHIKRKEVLRLFDTRNEVGTGFATAFSALAGEEMGLALLEHYLVHQGKKGTRVAGIPKTGRKTGPRLDGWLVIDNQLAQIEVKNWGADALAGLEHSGDPTIGWQQFLKWFARKENRKVHGLRKVLHPMQSPENYEAKAVELAIVCMWPIIHAKGETDCYFAASLSELNTPLGFETKFDRLHIFSMSAYLHQTEDEVIELDMPKTYARLQKFETILGIRGEVFSAA